jgi:ethylbenzene dioxygenase subunit beta
MDARRPVSGEKPVPALAVNAALELVYEEARLLDERRFEEWLQLFDEDGIYWVPSQPGQLSPRDTLSVFYEQRSLLAVRVNRLRQSSMHAQIPAVRTLHHVGAAVARPSGVRGIDLEVSSSLIVCEWRSDEGRWFAGRVLHHLRHSAGGLRIALKRVDLINCDAPHRALTVPL